MKTKLISIFLIFITFFLSGCPIDSGRGSESLENEGGISGSGGPVNDNEGGISGSGGVPTLPNLDVFDPSSAPIEFNKRFRSAQNKKSKSTKSTTKENFNHARSLFDSIELKLYTGLRDVASIVGGAYTIEPVEINEYEYHWIYSIELNGVSYDVLLTSIVKSKNVEWEMSVASNSTNKVLFTGTSTFKGDAGTWNITYIDSVATKGSVSISWEETTTSFKTYYSIIDEFSDQINDFAEFKLEGNSAHLVYFDFSTENVIELKWDTVLESGSVIDPLFKDGVESIWDNDKFDLEIDPDAF
ncbi:MAG: hypothetical protein COA79_03375 [Planctomycetota bacterium]|nr:MAG: hypothetical protein COA79_03375 [Planctomycetota bacterium]